MATATPAAADHHSRQPPLTTRYAWQAMIAFYHKKQQDQVRRLRLMEPNAPQCAPMSPNGLALSYVIDRLIAIVGVGQEKMALEDEDAYLHSSWANPKALKNAFSGVGGDVQWKGGGR